MCSLGIEPTTFSAANAMLYHWVTGTAYFQVIVFIILLFIIIKNIFYLELFIFLHISLWWKASILQYFFPLWFNNLIYGMDYEWLLSNRDIQNMQAQRCLSVWVTAKLDSWCANLGVTCVFNFLLLLSSSWAIHIAAYSYILSYFSSVHIFP